jgi:hypothetical protein
VAVEAFMEDSNGKLFEPINHSEKLVAEYFIQQGHWFQHEPFAGKVNGARNPDYLAIIHDKKVLVEVKEVAETVFEKRIARNDSLMTFSVFPTDVTVLWKILLEGQMKILVLILIMISGLCLADNKAIAIRDFVYNTFEKSAESNAGCEQIKGVRKYIGQNGDKNLTIWFADYTLVPEDVACLGDIGNFFYVGNEGCLMRFGDKSNYQYAFIKKTNAGIYQGAFELCGSKNTAKITWKKTVIMKPCLNSAAKRTLSARDFTGLLQNGDENRGHTFLVPKTFNILDSKVFVLDIEGGIISTFEIDMCGNSISSVCLRPHLQEAYQIGSVGSGNRSAQDPMIIDLQRGPGKAALRNTLLNLLIDGLVISR